MFQLSNMNDLPDYVILQIFSFLPLRENCSKQLVCRKWHSLLQDFSLWTEIRIKDDNHLASVITDEIIGIWLERWGHHVKTLQLRYCRKLTNFVGQLLSNNCSLIECIDFQGCIGIGDYGMALLAENCTRISKVNLFMTGATDVGFAELLRNVSSIRSIKLPSKGNCFRSLESICANCDALETLILNDVIPFDETDPVVSDTTIGELSRRFPTISKISLNWCWYVTDGCLAAIAENCNNLNHLVIRECHQVSDEGLITVVRMCPNLRKLQLGRLYGITDRLANGFLNKKNSLLRLKLIDTSITDNGVSKILENSPELRGLFIGEYCLNASKLNGELIFACSKYCKQLTELVIVSSNSVNDEMMCDIAENLPKLKMLMLSSCGGVGKVGLQAVIDSLKNLRDLRVCKCTEFDDSILKRAANELATLNMLEIYGCTNITKESLRKFRKKRPNCILRI